MAGALVIGQEADSSYPKASTESEASSEPDASTNPEAPSEYAVDSEGVQVSMHSSSGWEAVTTQVATLVGMALWGGQHG